MAVVGVVGQEGQIAEVVGQEADSREPDGAVELGKGGQMTRREGALGPHGSCWE